MWTCQSCERTYTTFNSTDGICRICKRKENNAHDLKMLTDDERKVIGAPLRCTGDDESETTKKQETKKQHGDAKEAFMNSIKELTDEQFQQILEALR